MNIIIILIALLLAIPGPAPASEIRTGRIVIHDAFPAVLKNFPERADPGVDGYIGTTDCREIGERFVLVRPGQPDALVTVADCAWSFHVAYRQRMNLIADVDRSLWTGPERPQYAELWPVDVRGAFLKERQEYELELRHMVR
jgi:hypothetical protein